MRIFITGSAGLIGSHLYFSLTEDGHSVYGIDIVSTQSVDSVVDISTKGELESKLEEIRPDVIVHAAAIKSLIECENNKQKSWDVNVQSTAQIVQFAKRNKTHVVYISSDLVFDGKTGNYKEGDLPNPINWYGVTKYHSELLIKEIDNYAICRTALVVGNLIEKNNPQLIKELSLGVLNNQSFLPSYVINRLKQKNNVLLPNTVISSPTHLVLLAKGVSSIIKDSLTGIYHLTGSESISRYKFALRIAGLFNLDVSLVGVDESNIINIRPKNLGMNVIATYRRLGISLSDWNIDALIIRLIKEYK